MSLSRPVTKSSPSLQEAQVAGPEERAVAVAERRAEEFLRLRGVAPSSPSATLGPETQISPMRSSAARDAGRGIDDDDAMAGGDLTAADQPPARAGSAPPRRPRRARGPRRRRRGRRAGSPRDRPRRAALPRPGRSRAGTPRAGIRPGRTRAAKRSSVSGRTGSAPLNATRQQLRSSSARCSGVVFSTQRS